MWAQFSLHPLRDFALEQFLSRQQRHGRLNEPSRDSHSESTTQTRSIDTKRPSSRPSPRTPTRQLLKTRAHITFFLISYYLFTHLVFRPGPLASLRGSIGATAPSYVHTPHRNPPCIFCSYFRNLHCCTFLYCTSNVFIWV